LKEYLNLRPPYGRLFEFKRSKLRFSKNVRFMLKMSCAGCPGPSPAISAQFTLKMGVATGNRKKIQ